MNTQQIDHLGRLFARQGLRCTQQRRAIYDCLAASTSHPTAEQLYHEVGGRTQGISLATVYNTLEAFCRAGLAKQLPGKGGCARYDALVQNHVHTHCEKTGAVHDLPEELGEMLLNSVPRRYLKRIEAELGFTVRQVRIDLVGAYGVS